MCYICRRHCATYSGRTKWRNTSRRLPNRERCPLAPQKCMERPGWQRQLATDLEVHWASLGFTGLHLAWLRFCKELLTKFLPGLSGTFHFVFLLQGEELASTPCTPHKPHPHQPISTHYLRQGEAGGDSIVRGAYSLEAVA